MTPSSDLSAVNALLEERGALRGWLDGLDARAASVPEAVLSRVRQDYQVRLDQVIDRLREHADAVASRLGADQAERDRLEQQARAAREALAEAELRHAVGEYDADRFEEAQRQHVAALDGYEQQLDALAERIGHLEDVHAAVTRPAVTGTVRVQEPTPVSTPDVVPEVIATETVAIESIELETASVDVPADEVPVRDEESLEDDLLSIFDPPTEAPAAPTVPFEEEAIRFEETAADPKPAGFGPLSFTPNAAERAPTEPVRPVVPPRAPPIGMPSPDSSPRFVRPGTERGSELVEVPLAPVEAVKVVPDPEPVLPETTREAETAARTLRCGECGAMNRPLEWYCEKCGAELNAI